PVIAKLEPLARPSLATLGEVQAYTQNGGKGVPINAIASTQLNWSEQRIERQDHFRIQKVYAQAKEGRFASQILQEISGPLEEFKKNLPQGYQLSVGGEAARQVDGFSQLLKVLTISALGIFLALVFQFESFIKPLLVFSAVPFGIAGSLVALLVTDKPFSFMAFLGIASLIGVIVSHIIVLFDFIDEREKEGEDLERALVDAGLMRLRPVLITVGATVLALIPLWFHGGPLWQPLCAAQIGGLLVATIISLVLVPAIYATCVLDLKILSWGKKEDV
ncbi:MAG: efflux RND transporter permease subunit, partial [Polyangiaceae bacterium]|nr:efflux RND transporter permease subunit [Polyangiaceae bacterium]